MAINTDNLKNGKGKGYQSPGGSTVEGGGDLTLAMTSTVQGQANQMVLAAHAANLSIDHASTQMAEYFADVMSGQALLNETLAKTAAKLEAMGGPVSIDTTVQPITLNLPESRNFAETRQRFSGLFGGSTPDIHPSYDLPAPIEDGDHDD